MFHGENFGNIFYLTKKVTADRLEKLENSIQSQKLTVNLTNEIAEIVSRLVLCLLFSKPVMDLEKTSMVV